MKFIPFHIKLKNGTTILVREAVVTDAEALIPVAKGYIEQSEFIPCVEGEFNPTVEDEEKWIQNFADADNSLLLLAICDGQIVGDLSVNGEQKQMMKHTAGIGVGLRQDFRGIGLGSILLKSVVEWATANPVLEYLWLEVFETNDIRIRLYEKFGFMEAGVKKSFIKKIDGLYIDVLLMTLRLK